MSISIPTIAKLRKHLSDNGLKLEHDLPDEIVRESRQFQIDIITEEDETEQQHDIVIMESKLPYVCISVEDGGKIFIIPLLPV
ncbi:hypothetical protein [Dinghuibacter silviterrae]|uniref:Uncharacterized protein n=1 Tax=Dinghuibacter silviterrae TaxID=1539049 RepID=A0A4R8DHT6_9BACT|nr:hypothetical protein [Dinghuibacter silviterrae]TDW97097.1 hypothetical protein EDB95_4937 [Dinghuibacter silviterrae]